MKRGARNPEARRPPVGHGKPQNFRRAYRRWCETRPSIVRVLALRFRPDRYYRIKATGQCCVPQSFEANGTLTVAVQDRILLTWHGVFGIKPGDLEPWPRQTPPMP